MASQVFQQMSLLLTNVTRLALLGRRRDDRQLQSAVANLDLVTLDVTRDVTASDSYCCAFCLGRALSLV